MSQWNDAYLKAKMVKKSDNACRDIIECIRDIDPYSLMSFQSRKWNSDSCLFSVAGLISSRYEGEIISLVESKGWGLIFLVEKGEDMQLAIENRIEYYDWEKR